MSLAMRSIGVARDVRGRAMRAPTRGRPCDDPRACSASMRARRRECCAAGQARRDGVAAPASSGQPAAVLERGVIGLRRREGVGLVLESTDWRSDAIASLPHCAFVRDEVSRIPATAQHPPGSPAVADELWRWDADARLRCRDSHARHLCARSARALKRCAHARGRIRS